MKNFWYLKDTVKKIKRQATDWEKIFVKHISDKGFESRIYKEPSKLSNKTNNTILKLPKDFAR